MQNVKQMPIEQKIGHLVCHTLIDYTPESLEFLIELIKKRACTAIRISATKRNEPTIKMLREAAGNHPLLIITDMETGYGPAGRASVPFLSLAACGNEDYARAFAAAVASDAKAAGFSGCWGPIVDILHGNGPCSVSRKSGDTPEAVYKFAKPIAEVFASYNFQSTGKHYPGGAYDLVLDTHMAEGRCSLTEEELLACDLVPYFKLWEDGLLPSIMTRHCVYPKIDPNYPASLSKKVIDIMRSRGYDGIIYTDSLAMSGILQKYGEREAMALAIEAGNDLIIPNYRSTCREVYDMLMESYRRGDITEERINESVERILNYAAKMAEPPKNPYPVPENIDEILSTIARDSITALCDDGVSPAIPTDKRRLFIVLTDSGHTGVEQEISLGGWYSPKRVINAIKDRFPAADVQPLSEYANAAENQELLNVATLYDEIVFVTFCTTGAYLGTDCLTRRTEAFIKALTVAGKVSTIVHFGNPLALDELYHVKRRIFGYLAPEAQIYAFDVLAGNIEPKGKNPFPSLLK